MFLREVHGGTSEIRKFRKAPTILQTQVSTMLKGNRERGKEKKIERERERNILWIMNGQYCTTDALLFGAVQSSGILLILRKRLAASFPVY